MQLNNILRYFDTVFTAALPTGGYSPAFTLQLSVWRLTFFTADWPDVCESVRKPQSYMETDFFLFPTKHAQLHSDLINASHRKSGNNQPFMTDLLFYANKTTKILKVENVKVRINRSSSVPQETLSHYVTVSHIGISDVLQLVHQVRIHLDECNYKQATAVWVCGGILRNRKLNLNKCKVATYRNIWPYV